MVATFNVVSLEARTNEAESGVDCAAPLPPEGRISSAATPSVRREMKLGGLSLADQALVSAANFLTLVILARFRPASEVGAFALAWTILGYLRTGQERLLAAPYLIFCHDPHQDPRTFLGSSFVHQTVFSILSCALVLLCAGFLVVGPQLESPLLVPTLVVLAFAIPGLLMRDHWRAVFGANLRFDACVWLDLGVGIFQVGGIYFLAKRGWLTPPIAVAVLGIACILPVAIAFRTSAQKFEFSSQRYLPDWWTSWSYSRWLVLARCIGIAGYFLIPWMVAAFLKDTAAVGIYSTCSNLVGLSLMFVMGLNNYFQPRTVQAFRSQGATGLWQLVWQCIAVLSSCLLLISLVFWLGGNSILGAIYGPTYSTSGHIVFLLSLSTFTVSISIASGNGLAALQKPKANFLNEFCYFITSMALACILIPKMGLAGAAWALIGGGVAASLVSLATLRILLNSGRRKEQPEDA